VEEPVGPAIQEVGAPEQYQPPADVVYGPEPDLSQDEAVAQSYDDGYDQQAAGEFQQALDPYGTWYDDATYGDVWVPSSAIVGTDFTPYATGGHWVLTEFGWTWVSDWGWGWAPFHYGRWMMLGLRGWAWVPGTIWGPGWVSWRAGNGLVGWAPLPPRGAALPPAMGKRTPWRFVQASYMGKPVTSSTYKTPAAVPGAFRGTAVVSTAAGTPGALHLAAVAPNAMPHASIKPRAGVPMAARPWVHSSAGQPAVTTRAVSYGQPARAAARPFGPQLTVGNSLRAAPRAQPRGFSGTQGPAATVPRQYGYAPPARAYTPPARAYTPPARYAPAARVYAPPARVYTPPVHVYSPPPVYHAAPAAPHTFAPAPHTFAPAAPSHFGSPGFGGGGVGHPVGGGGGRRR
jgi:hypothetical protein